MKKEDKQKEERKKILLLVLLMLGLSAIVVVTSYAWFQTSSQGGPNYIQVADGLGLTLEDEAIVIDNQMPMSDQYAMQEGHVEDYNFTLSSRGQQTVDFYITVDDEVVDLPRGVLRYAISDDNGATWSTPASFYTTELYVGSIDVNTDINFKMKVWVAYDTTTTYAGKTYTGKINIVTKTPDSTTVTPEPEPEETDPEQTPEPEDNQTPEGE